MYKMYVGATLQQAERISPEPLYVYLQLDLGDAVVYWKCILWQNVRYRYTISSHHHAINVQTLLIVYVTTVHTDKFLARAPMCLASWSCQSMIDLEILDRGPKFALL